MCTTMISRNAVKLEDRGPEETSRNAGCRQTTRASTEEASRNTGSRQSAHKTLLSKHGSKGPDVERQSAAERRSLRAQYQAIKLDIAEGEEVFSRLDSDRFDHVFSNVEQLYDQVRRPREQIADAEAIFDITAAFLASVKGAKRGGGLTAAEFITGIIKNFDMAARSAEERTEAMIDWGGLGREASAVLSEAPGMITMLGPMDIQPKQRKIAQRKPRDRAVETARPEELNDSTDSSNIETHKNMETMFIILKRLMSVSLEALVLNRNCFSQTVENIFALSFLVKDGRAKILIKNGRHIVAPMNPPKPEQRDRGEGSMSQFVFRFDFKDWKAMKDLLEEGTELMPHRQSAMSSNRGGSRTPVRKYCRNRAKETPSNDETDQNEYEGVDGGVPHTRKQMRI